MTFSLLGLFGGTFDPIHKGHLAVVNELSEKLPFEQIQLIPCNRPSLRPTPSANAADRAEMVKRAIAHSSNLTLNDIEIKRKGVSYSIDTLKSLHPLFPNQSLCFILAIDAFANFNQWHQWQSILNYCHLIIVDRPPYVLPKEKWLGELLHQHRTKDLNDLRQVQSGKIFFQHLSSSPISATEVRHYLKKGNYSAAKSLLPEAVFEYIKTKGLYQQAQGDANRSRLG